jgi:uracil-DNA glycosylase
MTNSFKRILVKAMQSKSILQVLDAPPDALRGLSAGSARKLDEAFSIRRLRQLAENRFFHRSMALLHAAGESRFDPGPPLRWERFLRSAPLDYYVAHPGRRFRLDFGPVYYRGRLDDSARVLVVGQDPSTNEILGHRVFVGHSGQRIQGFLRKLGMTRSYVMVNVFLFSVFGQMDAQLRAIALEPPILGFRNDLLDRLKRDNPIEAVIAVGGGARFAIEHWPGSKSVPVVEIVHPAAPNEAMLLASWNQGLERLRKLVEPDDQEALDGHPYGAQFRPQDAAPIPRFDLPFGVPDWHGTGAHSRRDGNKRIVWEAP